jgi:2-dehydro-3-deoxygluconokinase
MPGIEEAEFLLGEKTVEQYAAVFAELGPKVIVIKQGPEGSSGWVNGESVFVPGVPVSRVVDTVGAGDAFASGVLSILLDYPALMLNGAIEGVNQSGVEVLASALQRGNRMGAMAVQFKGDWEGLPTLADLQAVESGKAEVSR